MLEKLEVDDRLQFFFQVINRFLPHAMRLLSKDGLFYLVVLDQNKPSEFLYFLSLPQIRKTVDYCCKLLTKSCHYVLLILI